MSETYTATPTIDVSGHSVFYDGFGPGVPLRIRSDIVRRHVRDDGTCILTETVGAIETEDAVIRSWPEFAAFEQRLKEHLNEQIATKFLVPQ